MRIKCSRVRLNEAFAVASMVVPQRTTLPAITCVRLVASRDKAGGALELACTDMEHGLKYTVPAEVMEEGTLVLPAAKVGGILREADEQDITMESDGPNAHVRLPGASFKIVGLEPDDFPATPSFEEKGAVRVGTSDLGEMIRKTQFAVSTEVVRYSLTGQLLEVKGKEVRMVASDGKRMAYIRSRSSGRGEGQKDMRVIVPTKAMSLLDKVLRPEDEHVALSLEETQIRMRTSRAMIWSRIIEGQFPDYESVVPSNADKKLVVGREVFHAAVRKAALMAADKAKAVKLILGKGKMVLFTRAPDVGEARVEVPVDYKGDDLDVIFNADYIADYLKVLTDEEVELHLRDKTSAGVFRSGKDYQYVVMPLSIGL